MKAYHVNGSDACDLHSTDEGAGTGAPPP